MSKESNYIYEPNKFHKYFISEKGEVFNAKTGRKLTPSVHNKTGYLYLNLMEGEKAKTFYVQRLVAEIYLENPHNNNRVMFKDNDKTNCDVSNLMWASEKETTNNAIKNKGNWLLGNSWNKSEDNEITIELNDLELREGDEISNEVNIYKRNPKIKEWRNLHIDTNGCVCEFCDQNLSYQKGSEMMCSLASHHLLPISRYEHIKKKSTKKEEIAFICHNCHFIVHSIRENEDLQKMSKNEQKNSVIYSIKK